jgi:hypothetical protein
VELDQVEEPEHVDGPVRGAGVGVHFAGGRIQGGEKVVPTFRV